MGVVIPQAQFRSDELLEAIHGGFGLRTLMIAGVLFPLFQLTGFQRFDGFVAGMTFLPQRGVLSRRDGGLGSLLLQQGVTLFGVISAVGTDLFDLAPQGIEQCRQHLVIGHRVEADFGRDDGMAGSIHGQMEFAPKAPFLLAVLVNFPFAFAVDLEAGGINHQVSNRALAGQAVLDLYRLGALADATVVRRLQGNLHQFEQRVNEPLQGAQWQLEHALEHQRGLDGAIAVVKATSPAAMMGLAMPVLDGLLSHPDG